MADAQKTEQATPRRLKKARDEGNYASSRQFIGGAQFLAFVTMLQTFGKRWLVDMGFTMVWLFRHAFARTLTLNDWMSMMWYVAVHCIVPILIAAAGLLLLSLGLQLGLNKMGLSFKKLTPDFKRLNPATRIKQVARNNISSLLQALVLLPVCGYVVYAIVSDNVGLLALSLKSVPAAEADIFGALNTLLWRAAFVFFVFGCVDLVREKHHFSGDMRMSKQEIKDEHKETEGNPQIKMRIRRIQRDLARKRMMQDLPKATAVIVNPTHFAVALRYEPDTMAAPIVVAKGKNYLALRIRQKALDYQIPLVENPPLARGLYKAAEVGQEIPPHLYKAVAEILAYIFRLMHRR
ncbi:MAG TPA: EscU/YscU/HrcU family type III secretion system export apparatus switch protein [Candidatus Binataceae bacterium]|nr:EscU/YscU/HrcU family type III secretion system export apparatus switch protein [Candidatus Binataceae bacterium]